MQYPKDNFMPGEIQPTKGQIQRNIEKLLGEKGNFSYLVSSFLLKLFCVKYCVFLGTVRCDIFHRNVGSFPLYLRMAMKFTEFCSAHDCSKYFFIDHHYKRYVRISDLLAKGKIY